MYQGIGLTSHHKPYTDVNYRIKKAEKECLREVCHTETEIRNNKRTMGLLPFGRDIYSPFF